jgi:hypothetical protein
LTHRPLLASSGDQREYVCRDFASIKRNDLRTKSTGASVTKKQILSLWSSMGNGGDVPPLRRTTHVEIWFIFPS